MENKVISMFYELKDANTKEFLESNFNAKEISFLTNRGHIIEALEKEVCKMSIGEEKIISIKAADGAGEYDQNALQEIDKEQFAGIELQEGMELFGESEDGSTSRVVVKSIGDKTVMVDFNHPYAGRDLEFNVKVTDMRDATEDEILTGNVAGAHTCSCGHNREKDHECCGGGHHHHSDGECCGGGHHDSHECCSGHGHDKDHECCQNHKHDK